MALTKIDDRGLKTPIDLLDNEKIRLGTGNDLEIYHNGSNGWNYIQSVDNNIAIQAKTGENSVTCYADDRVELYFNHSKKFETYENGTTTTGHSVIHGNISMGDNYIVKLGNSDDLQIKHDGTDSRITNTAGVLYIDSPNINIRGDNGQEDSIQVHQNGAVKLFYNGVNTLSTTSQGAEVKIATGNTRLRVHSDTTSSPAPGIELMRGTNDTFGADAYTDWSILNSGANLVFSSADNGSTNTRLTIDYSGVLWHGVAPFANHFTNRSAYFHKSGSSDWNYISITGGTSGGSGIVFGDSVENNTGNYESLIAHDNTNNSLYLKTKQSEKGLELKVGGDVSILDGNLVVASGHGIDFSATGTPLSGSSSNSELFQDYERGSWTMGFQYYNTTTNAWTTVPFDNSPDYDSFDYVKCGHLVHVWGYTGGFDVGSDAVNKSARFTGLPYAAVWAAPYYGASCIFTHTSAFGDTSGNVEYVATGYTPYNEPVLYPMRPKTDSIAAWMNGSKTFMFSATYETAS